MSTTVEGVFRDGRIELRDAPPDVEEVRVIVTFLPESAEPGAPAPCSASEANRRMRTLLQAGNDPPHFVREELIAV